MLFSHLHPSPQLTFQVDLTSDVGRCKDLRAFTIHLPTSSLPACMHFSWKHTVRGIISVLIYHANSMSLRMGMWTPQRISIFNSSFRACRRHTRIGGDARSHTLRVEQWYRCTLPASNPAARCAGFPLVQLRNQRQPRLTSVVNTKHVQHIFNIKSRATPSCSPFHESFPANKEISVVTAWTFLHVVLCERQLSAKNPKECFWFWLSLTIKNSWLKHKLLTVSLCGHVC